MMTIRDDPLNLVIAGVGGQGNILLSRLVGRALVKRGFFVSIGETFGAAQRGGAVRSSIRISEKMSFGPLIPDGKVHIILSLEPMETLRMVAKFKNPNVITISNLQPVPPLAVLSMKAAYPDTDRLRDVIGKLSEAAFLNATDIARELGAPIVANIVMLGALMGKGLLPLTEGDIEREIEQGLPGRVGLNMEAFRMGMEAMPSAQS